MCSVSLHEARPIVLGSAAVHVALSVWRLPPVEVSFQAITDCNDRNGGPLHALVWHVRLRQWRRQSNASAQHFPILPIPWFFHWWALQPSHILGVHGDSASPTATWWACCDIAPRSPRHRASCRFSANMHSPASGSLHDDAAAGRCELECHADLASMASPAGLGTIHPSIAGAPTRPSMSYRFNAAESSVHSDTVMEKVSMASRRMAIHNFFAL